MTQLTLLPSRAPALERFERYMAFHGEIDGWFNFESAAIWDALLSRQRGWGVLGHLLEIGVWHGESAALLAMHADASRESCVLVDLLLERAAVERTLQRAGADLDAIRAMPVDSRMLGADPLIAEGYRRFRWAHVDGEHTGDAVANDMSVAHALLSTDGILVVDDFFNWLYPQITEAVFQYLRDNPGHFSLFLCGHNKAYLARPHRSHLWLAYCKEELVGALEQRGVQATLAKTTYPGEMNCFGIGPRYEGQALRGPDWEPGAIRI